MGQGGAVLQAEQPSWFAQGSSPCSHQMSHMLDLQWPWDKLEQSTGVADPKGKMQHLSVARVILMPPLCLGNRVLEPWETDGLEESRDDASVSVAPLPPGNAHSADKGSIFTRLQGKPDRNTR